MDLNPLIDSNARRWRSANLIRDFGASAKRLVAAKARYQAVEKVTGVPWFVIAVIHEREASQRWDAQLGQGDPLNEVSRHVPEGRGPFKTWEGGAFDALVNCAPYAARWKDWSAGGTLTLLERYNGMTYYSAGRPSPYVWSGTTVYDPPTGPGGKVLVDHGPIEDWHNGKRVVDEQLGCAGLLKAMMKLDSSIAFAGQTQQTPQPAPEPHPAPIPPPVAPAPAPPTDLWTLILSIIRAIFGKR